MSKSRYADIVIKEYRSYDISVKFSRFDCDNCGNIWAVLKQRIMNEVAFKDSLQQSHKIFTTV